MRVLPVVAALAALLAIPPAWGQSREPADAPYPVEPRAAVLLVRPGGLDVDAKRARLAALNVRETALAARLGRDRNRLAHLLSALQLFRRDPPPALLVSPKDARDAVRAAILIRAMTPELQRRADTLATEARTLAALRREAAAASAEFFAAESAKAEGRSDIERLLAEQEAARRRYADKATVGETAKKASGPPRLEAPLDGPVIRRFGQVMPAGGRSNGLFVRAAPGAKVTSPVQGTVEFAGPLVGWGVTLILRTEGAYHLVLAGLEQANVAPGQSVAAGAPVGRMADGGKSGPELYIEVREDGAPIDPARLMAGQLRRTADSR